MPTVPYRLADGTRVKGVTTIIGTNIGWSKNALMYWAWNEGHEGRDFRETRDKAADIGTISHYLFECDLKGEKPDVDAFDTAAVEKAETAFLNYLEWRKSVGLEPVAVEPHLVSEQYRYGGTPDCIGLVRGRLTLVDWKTAGGTYPDHLLQLAAYRQLWEENHPEEPLVGGFDLLRVHKDTGHFSYGHWDALPEAWQVFKLVLALDRLQKPLKGLC